MFTGVRKTEEGSAGGVKKKSIVVQKATKISVRAA
jgi:hypothetical protein